METINACGMDTPPFEGMSAILYVRDSKGINIIEDHLDITNRTIRVEDQELIISSILDFNYGDFASKFKNHNDAHNMFLLIRLEDYHRNFLELLYEIELSHPNFRFPNMTELVFNIISVTGQRLTR